MILVPVVLLLYPSVWFHKVTVSAMCMYNGFYLFLSRLRTIFLALENSPLSLSFYPCQLCRGLILCKWPRAQVISQQNAKPEFTARVMPGQWSGALVSNAGEKNGFPSVCHNKGTQSQAWLSAFFFGFKTYIETKTFYFYIFVVFFFFLFLNYHKILFIFISTPSFFFAFFFLWPLLIPGLILVTLFLRLFQTEDILDHAQAQTTLRPWTSFLPACNRLLNIYLSTVYQLAHCTKTD